MRNAITGTRMPFWSAWNGLLFCIKQIQEEFNDTNALEGPKKTKDIKPFYTPSKITAAG